MLNKEKHQLIMSRVLKDFYTDTSLASLLGFKGGTCAYFFYDLPRFSVDLDFDLLVTDDHQIQKLVFEKVKNILGRHGKIKDSRIKRYTIFFLLSYDTTEHNIKCEINIRLLSPDIKIHYQFKEALGISMLVAKEDYAFASKLLALTTRKKIAMRDIYDIWHFANNNWDINADIIKARTNKTIKEYLADCIATVERVEDNQILQGLGELLPGEKEKTWVKTHLRKETIFLLKNYMSVMK